MGRAFSSRAGGHGPVEWMQGCPPFCPRDPRHAVKEGERPGRIDSSQSGWVGGHSPLTRISQRSGVSISCSAQQVEWVAVDSQAILLANSFSHDYTIASGVVTSEVSIARFTEQVDGML